MCWRLSAKPGELAFGIVPGRLFGSLDRVFKRDAVPKMGDQFGHADRAHHRQIGIEPAGKQRPDFLQRSEEHTSELQSLMRISYAVFCLKKKNITPTTSKTHRDH